MQGTSFNSRHLKPGETYLREWCLNSTTVGKNKSFLTAPVTVVWGPGLAGTMVQSPLNCQLSKQTVCYWNRRICFPLGLRVICIEPWEFPSYKILKLSLLKQERDPRAWRFWVGGLDLLIMGAKGRSATSFNIWTAMFIKVGTEMPVASPLALAMWAESSCVAACPPHHSDGWLQPWVPKIYSNRFLALQGEKGGDGLARDL